MKIETSGLQPPLSSQPHALSTGEKQDKGFLETLKESIHLVNEAQIKADQAVTDLETGKRQNLHETMIALQKADLSFELMMQVRNKIVNAYEEINKMQI